MGYLIVERSMWESLDRAVRRLPLPMCRWPTLLLLTLPAVRCSSSMTLRKSGRDAVIMPSLLAADPGNLATACREAASAGVGWIHVDIGDGSSVAGGALTSMGPATVAAVRAAAPALKIDVHLAVASASEHVDELAAAGADRITLQFEGLKSVEQVAAVVNAVRDAGCAAGLCIRPSTPVEAIEKVRELVETGFVDLVDILSVEPGRGGQPFQESVLDKVAALRRAFPSLPYLMVDGGITERTAPLAAAAGANVLVAGSYLFGRGASAFGHGQSAELAALPDRLEELQQLLLQHGE